MSASTAAGSDPAELALPPAIVPYLGVSDARRALDWYVEVFDAERRGEAYVNPDGSIGHAELGIGDAVLMLAEYGPRPAAADQPATGPAHSLFVTVPDADRTVDRAVSAGATLERPVTDEAYGRTGVIIDPFGHRWMVSTRPRSATRARAGDIVYVTIWVQDQEQAVRFYENVLGTRVRGNTAAPTVSIAGLDQPYAPEDARPATVPVYRVTDLDAALERVRAAGGRTTEASQEPYGRIADCYDPEDTWFALWETPRG
ncbi:VOC family protein [Microlunatus endophyticus]|nr:VOC family protein [Microlunatus endophyticus]